MTTSFSSSLSPATASPTPTHCFLPYCYGPLDFDSSLSNFVCLECGAIQSSSHSSLPIHSLDFGSSSYAAESGGNGNGNGVSNGHSATKSSFRTRKIPLAKNKRSSNGHSHSHHSSSPPSLSIPPDPSLSSTIPPDSSIYCLQKFFKIQLKKFGLPLHHDIIQQSMMMALSFFSIRNTDNNIKSNAILKLPHPSSYLYRVSMGSIIYVVNKKFVMHSYRDNLENNNNINHISPPKMLTINDVSNDLNIHKSDIYKFIQLIQSHHYHQLQATLTVTNGNIDDDNGNDNESNSPPLPHLHLPPSLIKLHSMFHRLLSFFQFYDSPSYQQKNDTVPASAFSASKYGPFSMQSPVAMEKWGRWGELKGVENGAWNNQNHQNNNIPTTQSANSPPSTHLFSLVHLTSSSLLSLLSTLSLPSCRSPYALSLTILLFSLTIHHITLPFPLPSLLSLLHLYHNFTVNIKTLYRMKVDCYRELMKYFGKVLPPIYQQETKKIMTKMKEKGKGKGKEAEKEHSSKGKSAKAHLPHIDIVDNPYGDLLNSQAMQMECMKFLTENAEEIIKRRQVMRENQLEQREEKKRDGVEYDEDDDDDEQCLMEDFQHRKEEKERTKLLFFTIQNIETKGEKISEIFNLSEWKQFVGRNPKWIHEGEGKESDSGDHYIPMSHSDLPSLFYRLLTFPPLPSQFSSLPSPPLCLSHLLYGSEDYLQHIMDLYTEIRKGEGLGEEAGDEDDDENDENEEEKETEDQDGREYHGVGERKESEKSAQMNDILSLIPSSSSSSSSLPSLRSQKRLKIHHSLSSTERYYK